MNLQRSGISECTAPGGKREDIVVAGVIKDGNGYKVNDQSVSLERYYKALATGRAGISEAYIYDATNIRLRNIALSYRFPSSMLKKTPFQQTGEFLSVCIPLSDKNVREPRCVYDIVRGLSLIHIWTSLCVLQEWNLNV